MMPRAPRALSSLSARGRIATVQFTLSWVVSAAWRVRTTILFDFLLLFAILVRRYG